MHKVKNSYLHEDVMDEIWWRLPVKSLIRFKCVCKNWGAKFQNPDFVEAHHRNQVAIDNVEFMPSKVFFKRAMEEGETFFTSFELTIDENENVTIKYKENIFLPFLFRRFEPSIRLKYEYFYLSADVFDHCNGIICLTRFDDVLLWNPATREVKFLPSCPFMPAIGSISYITGFGYDPKNDDYKILKTVRQEDWGLDMDAPSFRSHQVLYSLKKNEWKLLPCEYDWISTPADNLYINGFYHIVCGSVMILSLDLIKEEFIATDFPPCDFTFHLIQLLPGGEDNCVGMVRYVQENGFFEIWTLKEIGVKYSWIKQKTMGPIKDVTHFFGLWKKKLWLEIGSEQMVLYDLENEKLHSFEARFCDGEQQIPRPSTYKGEQFIHYVESLVSISVSERCEREEEVVRSPF